MHTKSRPYTETDKTMSFTDITESFDRMIDVLYWGIEPSLEKLNGSGEEEFQAQETLDFIGRLKDFIDDEYLKANSEFLNAMLF